MGGFRFGADFAVDGDTCEAWLYAPVQDPDNDAPTVVMAGGFAAERRWRLPALARRFAEAGVAALLFDYRGFGGSEGTRHVVDPGRHVADYRAAVERARGLDRTGDRVAVWGSSFSGGHALVTAAEERVDALAVQVPFLDGPRQLRLRWGQAGTAWLAWALAAGLRDRLGALLRRSPHYVPVAGDPGERAVLTSPSAKPGYERLVPDGEEWPNRCAARVLATVPFYRPLARAEEVDCPTLVVEGERDDVVPTPPVEDLVDALDDVERLRLDAGHFDVYTAAFDRVAGRHAGFFARHLLDGRPGRG